MLDQAQGEVASWSRLSYYAGLAPGRGLSMPNDVAIYPLFSGSEFRRNGDLGAARELEWDENRALFTRGWLRSRTPTQYLAVRAGTSSQRIVLRAENGRMQGGNSLGTAIRYVVVADSAGKLFAGENVPQGATAELEPVEPAVAEERWRTLVRENRPQPPLEATDAYALSQLSFDRRSRNNQYYFPATRLSNNLMEKTLADWTGMDGQPPNWGRRTYLALAETSPEIALGVPNASEEASFHVVIGKW
jgi:hypothetical protein